MATNPGDVYDASGMFRRCSGDVPEMFCRCFSRSGDVWRCSGDVCRCFLGPEMFGDVPEMFVDVLRARFGPRAESGSRDHFVSIWYFTDFRRGPARERNRARATAVSVDATASFFVSAEMPRRCLEMFRRCL